MSNPYRDIRFIRRLFDAGFELLDAPIPPVEVVDGLLDVVPEAHLAHVVGMFDAVHVGDELVEVVIHLHRLLDAAGSRVGVVDSPEVFVELFDHLGAVLAGRDRDSVVWVDHGRGDALAPLNHCGGPR